MPNSQSTCWTVIRAAAAGSPADRNLPIRAVAERWGVDARSLHHAYALARQDFKAALPEVVAFHQTGTPVELEAEAASLLKALS